MLEQDVIRELVASVWETILGAPVQPIVTSPNGMPDDSLRGSVAITGAAWNGSVAVELSAGDALRAASIMLEAKPGEIAADEVKDVVGELANVLGGNLKALLPQPLDLGLPEVNEGAPAVGGPDDSSATSRFLFDWEGSPFSVVVTEGSRDPEGPM